MGLFDKVNKDGTGSTGLMLQAVVAFAKFDLVAMFKLMVPGVVSLVTNSIAFFKDIFGHSDCNDQDRTLVERYIEQIPGMAILLSDLGYLDHTIGESLREDPNRIYSFIKLGAPKGAEPCNSLLYSARLLFTILFGVRIINQHFLDGLQRGVSGYYEAAGLWGTDIPLNAVERAVMLKQQFFPDYTYNTEQWDLNKFQEYPLVAPVPDPMEVGKYYTGEFLGIKIVDGYAIGDIIPDIGTDETPDTPTGGGTLTDENPLDRLVSFVKANPVPALLIAAGLVMAYDEDENE
jgi:hypothetical protein